MSSRNFSQKTNEQICFSILTTRKYLKIEFQFQLSSISGSGCQDRKQIRSFIFLGEVTARQFCFGVCYLFRKLSNSSKELYGEKQFFRVYLVTILKVLGFSADDYHWLCSLVQSINHRTDLERKFALLRFHDFSSQHRCAKCNQKSWPIMELDSNIICIRLECFRLRS